MPTDPLLTNMVLALEASPRSSLDDRSIVCVIAGEPGCDAAVADAADEDGQLVDVTDFMAERPHLWPDRWPDWSNLRVFGLRRHWPDDDHGRH